MLAGHAAGDRFGVPPTNQRASQEGAPRIISMRLSRATGNTGVREHKPRTARDHEGGPVVDGFRSTEEVRLAFPFQRSLHGGARDFYCKGIALLPILLILVGKIR